MTKAKLIALSIFGLAMAAAPASMILNAPDANARAAHPAPSANDSAEYTVSGPSIPPPPVVEDVDEVRVVANPKPAKKAQEAPKKAHQKKWTCHRIPLTPNRPALATKAGAPAYKTVQLCEWL